MTPTEAIRAEMRAYAGGEDSPPMRVCAGLLALAQKLDIQIADLHKAVRRQAPCRLQQRNRMLLLVPLVVAAAFVGGGAVGWWTHGSQQMVAGVSAGQTECAEVNGGTLCRIPVWSRLPVR